MHLHLFCAGPNSPLKNTSQIKRLQRQILKYLKNSSRSLLVRTGGSCVILGGCYVKDNTKKRHSIVVGYQESDISGQFWLEADEMKSQEKDKDKLKRLLLSPAVQTSLYLCFVPTYFKCVLWKYFNALFLTNVIRISCTIFAIDFHAKCRIFFGGQYTHICTPLSLPLFCKVVISQLLYWNDMLAENHTGT